MSDLSRREFSQATLGSLLTFSLLETLCGSDVLADDIKPVAAKWLADLHEMGGDLRGQSLTQQQWQQKVEQLFAKVELPGLLEFIDFDKLTHNLKFRDQGERSIRPRFPKVQGLPTDLIFGHQVFALKKDRSVVPHGHNNMATAFYVLKGEFHGRHYDRLEDDREHMIVRPTIDDTFGPGGCTTVTDEKDNVHWFKALSEKGFIFNIHVLNVDPKIRKGGRVYIDPDGEKLSDGRVRAKKLRAIDAYKLFG